MNEQVPGWGGARVDRPGCTFIHDGGRLLAEVTRGRMPLCVFGADRGRVWWRREEAAILLDVLTHDDGSLLSLRDVRRGEVMLATVASYGKLHTFGWDGEGVLWSIACTEELVAALTAAIPGSYRVGGRAGPVRR